MPWRACAERVPRIHGRQVLDLRTVASARAGITVRRGSLGGWDPAAPSSGAPFSHDGREEGELAPQPSADRVPLRAVRSDPESPGLAGTGAEETPRVPCLRVASACVHGGAVRSPWGPGGTRAGPLEAPFPSCARPARRPCSKRCGRGQGCGRSCGPRRPPLGKARLAGGQRRARPLRPHSCRQPPGPTAA